MYHELKEEEDDATKINIIFTLLGFSYLFPFWALLQPVDFWTLLFPEFNVEFDISWAYTIASVAALLLIVFYLQSTREHNARILIGLAIQVLVLAVLPLLTFFTVGRYTFVLCATILVAIATSFLDSSVFGLVSLFPKHAVEHVQLGIGLSGLVAAIYRVTSKASLPATMVPASTVIYFLVGALTVSLAIPAYLHLHSLPSAMRCMSNSKTQETFQFGLLKKVIVSQSLIALTFGSTLIVYPGVVSSIRSYQMPMLNANGWWQLILLLLHVVMEVLGRYCARYTWVFTAQNIWRPIVARLVLIPPLVCAAKGVLFTHDSFTLLFIMLLSFSNGYLGTVAIVVANQVVDKDERTSTGMFTSLSINVGMIIGSTISFVLAKVLNLKL